MDHEGSAESQHDATLGRIPLKQVRVKRGEGARPANAVNFLVPYLDLFWRLDDGELGRLAGVDAEIVAGLRKQVIEVDRALERYVDLLPRLTDDELVRLTGATEKTIRFWRLCQPRVPPRDRAPSGVSSPKDTRNPEPSQAAAVRNTQGSAVPPPSTASAVVEEGKRKRPDARTPRNTPERANLEGRDAKVTINPAAQATVDSMMSFSGAPFPGYDGEAASKPPPDEISLADAEAPEVRRG
jgi:hypothetical protein